jgi:hypothetical protein
MIDIDELISLIDKDPEVTVTVDDAIRNTKAGDVVSLGYFRFLKETYKGWKPVSMEDYAAQLRGNQKEIIERELRKARMAANKRVIRQNNLKK